MLATEASVTAKICAFARAHHSYFAREKIYDDYLAYDLIGKADYQRMKNLFITILEEKSWQLPEYSSWNEYLDGLVSPVVLTRIRYAEEFLHEKEKRDPDLQYVICGAGMDSFAFRNTNPELRIFELDHPNTQQYKAGRVRKLEWKIPENVQYIPIDFQKQTLQETLPAYGFDPGRPTVFSILGVSYYLSLEDLEKTVKGMSKITSGRCSIIMDYPDNGLFGEEKARMTAISELAGELGEQMKTELNAGNLTEMLQKHGFTVREDLNGEKIQKGLMADSHQKAYRNIRLLIAEK